MLQNVDGVELKNRQSEEAELLLSAEDEGVTAVPEAVMVVRGQTGTS